MLQARARSAVALAVLTALTALAVGVGAAGTPEARAGGRPVREVGALVGLPTSTPSYAVHARDVDGDRRPDLLLVNHGRPAQLFRNTGDGFEIATTFVDTIHGLVDRHDCAWGDVDRDRRLDLYCVKGARVGTSEKFNELWMQRADGTFVDRAGEYRVIDRWGRGRRTTFIDLNHDPYPDLFVGNNAPRQDGRPTPNRTFLNVDGRRFRRVGMGLTEEAGSFCVDVADLDGDGWDDLLTCEKRGLRLYLRRGARFVDATSSFGVPSRRAVWAELVDVDRDGERDLVVVTEHSVTVRLRARPTRFSRPVLRRSLVAGHGFAVGDLDGRRGTDLVVVEGCLDDLNVDDVVLLNGGDARSWRERPAPSDVPGCGDGAVAIDADGDGDDEVVVTNGSGQGQPDGVEGPVQLLTLGAWPGS
jgi:FG-GAP-like repeat